VDRTHATQAARGLLDFLTSNPPANDLEQAALTRLTTDWEGSVDIATEVLDSEQAQTTAPGTWETRDLFAPEQLAEAGTTPSAARFARETAAPQPGDRARIIRDQDPCLPTGAYVGLTGRLITDHSANGDDLR
jgi:hypothetical protein